MFSSVGDGEIDSMTMSARYCLSLLMSWNRYALVARSWSNSVCGRTGEMQGLVALVVNVGRRLRCCSTTGSVSMPGRRGWRWRLERSERFCVSVFGEQHEWQGCCS